MMMRLGPVAIYVANGLDCWGDAVYHDGQTEEFCVDDAGRESLTGRCYVESEKVPRTFSLPGYLLLDGVEG